MEIRLGKENDIDSWMTLVNKLIRGGQSDFADAFDGHSLKEIAAAVGFKTPSAVSKHIEKIAERYKDFVSSESNTFLYKHIQCEV